MPEATNYPKTILLEGEQFGNHEEYRANAALKPGHLLLRGSNGKVLKNSSASTPCRKLFAKEEDKIGRTIADAYAEDEVVPCHVAQPNHLIYAWVPASAAALVIGDKLKSDGTGCLIKVTAASDYVIGMVEEAVDNSAGGAEARVKVRIS
jgi:hypothetical protein